MKPPLCSVLCLIAWGACLFAPRLLVFLPVTAAVMLGVGAIFRREHPAAALSCLAGPPAIALAAVTLTATLGRMEAGNGPLEPTSGRIQNGHEIADLKVEASTPYPDSTGQRWGVKAVVTNTTGRDLEGYEFLIVFRDSEGREVGSSWCVDQLGLGGGRNEVIERWALTTGTPVSVTVERKTAH